MSLKHTELGKKSSYDANYNPDKLFPISRREKRLEIGVDPDNLPFYGIDYWNHYEVSWLNEKGKPINAIAEIIYDCRSNSIIESKSMKLYFNSFNNTQFKDVAAVEKAIKEDIAAKIESEVSVKVCMMDDANIIVNKKLAGVNIDHLDITCDTYQIEPAFLSVEAEIAEEVLYSDLLKSNCLVTLQPDWASIQISYKGRKINHEGLLKYLVSFRNHNEFHEQCIERIFADIMRYCKPTELTVYGRYTRRGGLDINPYRSSKPLNGLPINHRLTRQ